MSWWGKILGGAFGMMLGGPVGAALGAALGHGFDKGLTESASATGEFGRRQRAQTVFYTATFSIMGHICKLDGRISEDEIALARQVMWQMDLNAEQRQTAIRLFNEGKKDGFPLPDMLRQFKREIGPRSNLFRMFVEIQIMAAYADGVLHPAERGVLLDICRQLGIAEAEFEHLCRMIGGPGPGPGPGAHGDEGRPSLQQAYAVLDIDPSAGAHEIKKAYRRLLSRHHPDKLVARGLPEEMMKIAAERTHEIRQAYEVIKAEKGF